MLKVLGLVVGLAAAVLGQQVHTASSTLEAAYKAAQWYDASVVNSLSVSYNLAAHSRDMRATLRYAETRNYQVLSADWSKLASPFYPLVLDRYVTAFHSIDPQIFVVEGDMCATNNNSTLGYPRYCTPFIRVYEYNPSLNKTMAVIDHSNYDPNAHVTGYYCCAGRVGPCGAPISFVQCPASQILPLVDAYYTVAYSGATPGSYEKAVDYPLSAVHVNLRRRRALEDSADEFLDFLIDGRGAKFHRNVNVCLPHSSACGLDEDDLYHFMTERYGKIHFSMHHLFIVSDSKYVLTGVAEVHTDSGEYEIFNLAFSVTEGQGRQITRVVVAADMGIIAHANGFCTSDDIRCKILEPGTSLSSRFTSAGVSDFDSLFNAAFNATIVTRVNATALLS